MFGIPPAAHFPATAKTVQFGASCVVLSLNQAYKTSQRWWRLLSRAFSHSSSSSCKLALVSSPSDAAIHMTSAAAAAGISRDNIEMLPLVAKRNVFDLYAAAAAAADTLIYNGGTTSLDSIFVGTPVVTLPGDRWTRRMSSSLLVMAGPAGTRWIARDDDDYVVLLRAAARGKRHKTRSHVSRAGNLPSTGTWVAAVKCLIRMQADAQLILPLSSVPSSQVTGDDDERFGAKMSSFHFVASEFCVGV
jgi:hypothetical protein